MDEQKKEPATGEPQVQTTEAVAATDLQSELDKKAQELAALKDQLLRARADHDNYRKLARKEREQAREGATIALAGEVFFVIDDLERVLAHLDPEESKGTLGQGVLMVRDKLVKTLADHGIRPIALESKLYDPAYHEAVATEVTDRVPANTILDEVRRGYRMGDRVIRPAQVRVAVAPPPAPPEAADPSGNGDKQSS